MCSKSVQSGTAGIPVCVLAIAPFLFYKSVLVEMNLTLLFCGSTWYMGFFASRLVPQHRVEAQMGRKLESHGSLHSVFVDDSTGEALAAH